MILVIGGRGSGKRAWTARHLGLTPEEMETACRPGGTVLCNLQDREPLPPLEELLNKQAVICDEIGCGIVPIDRADENWRESVGRLCCALAQKADAVVRVIAGVPQFIKGEQPSR